METIRLLLDFGLVVLIWMVQLILYPSFIFYTHENLGKWHAKYTIGISLVVIPLMVGQLAISFLQLINNQGLYEIISISIVVLLWVSTFVLFVPLHNNISNAKDLELTVKKLAQRNWIRTFLWTTLFILSFWNTLKPW